MIRGSKPVLGTVAASRRLGQFESSAAHGNFAVIIAPGRATRQTTTPNQAQHHAISDSSCLGGFLEIPSRYSKRPETSVGAKQATQAKREVAMTLTLPETYGPNHRASRRATSVIYEEMGVYIGLLWPP